MSRITNLSAEELEDRLEQVANLLALWKGLLPEYKDKLHTGVGVGAYARFKLCIDELESVLTGKPLL